MKQAKHYWFPAKRYGWGWGFPYSWQGWLVTIVYLGLLIATFVCMDPQQSPTRFVLTNVVLVVAMISVCWWKGEPPRWRWGKDD